MAQQPTLFTLPVELQDGIIELLPYPNLQVLHATHPDSRTLIDFEKIRASKPHMALVEELIIAARSDEFLVRKNLYACTECLRLLPHSHFADKARKNHGYNGWFCIKCGLNTRYQPGARINCMGFPGVYCLGCRIFKQGEAELAGKSQPYCADCLWRRATPRRILEEEKLKDLERQRRAERKARRAEWNEWRRQNSGSASSYDTEEETSDEAFMRMVQSDAHMNSPKGSD